MPMTNRMNRMVSFRLSEEEYSQVKQMLSDGSARSISDVVRSAMSKHVSPSGARNGGDLRSRVGELELEVRRLKTQVAYLSNTTTAGD